MSSTPRPRVLLVDDEPTSLFSLRYQLQDEFEVVGEAANGELALERCRDTQPDLVVMDINMPVMDGITATRLITERYPDVTTVILSSRDDIKATRAAMAAGARDFLTKPVENLELLTVLQRAARQQQERRHLMVGRKEVPGAGIWAFLEPTGGVGQTTLLLSLANELLNLQKRVLVVDLGLLFGDVMLYLDLRAAGGTLETLSDAGARLDNVTVEASTSLHSSKLKVLAPPLDPFTAVALDPARLAKVVLSLERSHDFVLVDLPPGIPEHYLEVLDAARLLFLSTNDSLGGLKNLKVMLQVLSAMKYPPSKLRPMIVGQRAGEMQREQLETILGQGCAEFLHVFPRDDDAVSTAERAGQPASRHAPESSYTQAVREVLVPLLGLPPLERTKPQPVSFLKRLFG